MSKSKSESKSESKKTPPASDESTASASNPIKFLIDVESKALASSFSDLEDVSIETLMKILPKLIQHVENYRNLKGDQKRSLVISIIRHIIDVTDGPGEDDLWDPILTRLVPSLIDTLVDVNDGKLRLRRKPKKTWLRKLLSCLGL